MIKIAIVDDNKIFSDYIQIEIEQINHVHLIETQLDVYLSGEKLYSNIESNEYYDILLLDIKLDNENGLNIARKIRKLDENVIIIFISSYTDYLVDLFEVSPLGFVQKPLDHIDNKNRFLKLYLDAIKRVRSLNLHFFYKYKNELYRIPLKEILYFESKGRLIYIITKEKVLEHVYYDKLDNIELELNESKFFFIRISQSYLVNSLHILKFGYHSILMADGTELVIGVRYKNHIREKYIEINNKYIE